MESFDAANSQSTELDVSGEETFELVYDGPDVADGTIDARELADVLTGLTRAVSTVASEADLGDRYRLRIKDVEANSFHLILQLLEYAQKNPPAATAIVAGAAVVLSAVTNITSGLYKVITDLATMIDAKRRTKGQRIALLKAEFQDGNVIITFLEDKIILTKEQYELLLSQRIDRPLSQIVGPLELNRIDSFEMRRSNSTLVTVKANERDYFDYVEVVEEKSKEGTEIIGTLNSLSKNTLRGTFYTAEGVHVPYHYSGGDVAKLLRGFAARDMLRVHGKIKYGTDGVPKHIEVQDVDVLQRGFFDKQ
jgi:hypothetical protein